MFYNDLIDATVFSNGKPPFYPDDARPTVYILSGLPGSGKSTWCEQFTEAGIAIVSTDNFIEDAAKSVGLNYNEVFEDLIKLATRTMYERISFLVDNRQTFVWDQTNLTVKKRQNCLSRLHEDTWKVGVFFEADEAVRQERLLSRLGKYIPKHIDETMVSAYTRPVLSEGFDIIMEGNIEQYDNNCV